MRATVSSWSCLCWSQDGGVEGYAFIFSCENYRITTCCRTTIDRRTNKCIYRTKIHSIVERAHLKSTFLKESMKRRLAQSRDRAEVHTQGDGEWAEGIELIVKQKAAIRPSNPISGCINKRIKTWISDRCLQPDVHCIIMYNSQDTEITHLSIKG